MIRVLLAAVGALALAGGCQGEPPGSVTPSGSGPAGADRIVAIAGTVGAMSLVAASPTGASRLVPIQTAGWPPDAAWLSGAGPDLVVTTLRGATFGSRGPDPTSWVAMSGDLGGGQPSRAFGSLEPVAPGAGAGGETGRIAVVEGDPGSGGPGRLIVETLAGLVLRRFNLPAVPESAPCWLPDGRIAVVLRDARDQPTTELLDPASGRTSTFGGPSVRSIALGAGTVATLGVDGTVRAGSLAGWLANEPLPAAFGAGGGVALQAQPSPSGAELAVVVADPGGDAGSIRILAPAGGWHEIARFGLPRGANRAVVSWLAAP